MATTAVAVSVRGTGRGWVGEAAWVGDSPLWHLERPTAVDARHAARPTQDSEADYHSAASGRCRRPDGACSWCSFRIRGGRALRDDRRRGEPADLERDVRNTLARLVGRPPDPFTFAAQVGFARKSHMDDRTVVGIWPDGE